MYAAVEFFYYLAIYVLFGWILFSVIGGLIGLAVEAPPFKGALVGLGVWFALPVIAGVFIILMDVVNDRKEAKMAAEIKAAKEHVELMLLQRCKEEERLAVAKTVPPGSSIFVNLFPRNEAPTAAQASSVVPTETMKKYRALSYMGNDTQYRKPISWIMNTGHELYFIAKLMQTDLVDYSNKRDGKEYWRLATKQRWEKDGLSDLAIAYTEKYEDDRKFRNWPDGVFKKEVPIDRPGAQYMLTIEDVSTIEDRNDFLARGRMRLSDTSTGKVIAEYLGFQSIVATETVCPSVKEYPLPHGRYSVSERLLSFFFGAVLLPSDSAPAVASPRHSAAARALPDRNEVSPRSPAVSPAPSPTFVPNTELHLIGVYKGVTAKSEEEAAWWQNCRRGSGSHSLEQALECGREWPGYQDPKEIRVEVRRTVAPVILALMSYEPAVWKLEVAPGARVERILLSGYHAQDIEGAPGSAPVEVRTYRASACRVCQVKPGYFQAYDTASQDYRDAVQKLKTITGLEPKSFQGNYDAGFFVLDDRSY
jgi:hypothetical protein